MVNMFLDRLIVHFSDNHTKTLLLHVALIEQLVKENSLHRKYLEVLQIRNKTKENTPKSSQI